MESNKRKRTDISLEKKLDIIRDVERGGSGVNKADIARKHGIAPTTLQTILKNKDKITTKVKCGDFQPDRKRMKTANHEDVNTAVYSWFKQQRSLNLAINEDLLQSKARQYAQELGKPDFVASNGWLHNFKMRYKISSKVISGESGSVDIACVQQWQDGDMQDILQKYDASNIFNADETGIFWKCLPDRTLAEKGEKVEGRKVPKDRITALIAANMDRSQKLPILVIGKSTVPRCFRGRKSLPTHYKHNKKGWMLSGIFEEWVRALDAQMAKERRKICLLVDNAPSHPHLENLTNVELRFLPPNTTSLLQPCDQGIIQALKKLYRRKVLIKFIAHYEEERTNKVPLDLFAAITLLAESWQEISQSTIQNCFRHAGFEQKDHPATPPAVPEEVAPDFGNIFKNMARLLELPHEVTAEAYLNIDADAETTALLSDGDILSMVNGSDKKEDEEEEPEEAQEDSSPVLVPSTLDMFAMLDRISAYVSAHGTDDTASDCVSRLRRYVETKAITKTVQSDIRKFF